MKESQLPKALEGLLDDLSLVPDGVNWLMEDLSMVPEEIVKIAKTLESIGYKCLIKAGDIAFKGNYDEFKLSINKDMSARLNLYIHIEPGHSAPFLAKIASTPNMEFGINRIIESDNEFIFSVDIPHLKGESYKEQLEYYTRLLHDYEFNLFLIM